MSIKTVIFFLFFSIAGIAQVPQLEFHPRHYIVYRTLSTLCIDGKLNENAWTEAPWSADFTDIEGFLKPKPKYTTRVKMLWDDDYLYVAAYLEEPHIWASLTERESVIFYDNDFEIFIDPDGDTHNYMEFEINALGTEWDLFLCKPYRDTCFADNSWNFEGLNSAINICGTINNPTDTDTCWTVEIAIPWKSVIKYSATQSIPVNGEQWRINFSRVQWDYQIINGIYIRKRDKNGHLLPEHNWVWSPQDMIAMHRPETWGFVQFSDKPAGSESVEFIYKKADYIKWILRQVYYLQKSYYLKHHLFADNLSTLQKDTCLIDTKNHQITIDKKEKNKYTAKILQNDTILWYIRQDGKVFMKKVNE